MTRKCMPWLTAGGTTTWHLLTLLAIIIIIIGKKTSPGNARIDWPPVSHHSAPSYFAGYLAGAKTSPWKEVNVSVCEEGMRWLLKTTHVQSTALLSHLLIIIQLLLSSSHQFQRGYPIATNPECQLSPFWSLQWPFEGMLSYVNKRRPSNNTQWLKQINLVARWQKHEHHKCPVGIITPKWCTQCVGSPGYFVREWHQISRWCVSQPWETLTLSSSGSCPWCDWPPAQHPTPWRAAKRIYRACDWIEAQLLDWANHAWRRVQVFELIQIAFISRCLGLWPNPMVFLPLLSICVPRMSMYKAPGRHISKI